MFITSKKSQPRCDANSHFQLHLLGQDLSPPHEAANWSVHHKNTVTPQITKQALEEKGNLIRTIQILDRLNCLLTMPLSLHWLHGEPQERISLSILVKWLKLDRINLGFVGESHFIHGLIHVYVLFSCYTCIWSGLNVHFCVPYYDIYFHPVTSGVLKGVLMEMAVCSTAFNLRRPALCMYSGILDSVHVYSCSYGNNVVSPLWERDVVSQNAALNSQ